MTHTTIFQCLEKAPFKRKCWNVSTPTSCSDSDWLSGHPINCKSFGITSRKLEKYFPSLSSDMYDCIRNLFIEFSPNSQSLLSLQEEHLSELQCDPTLKIKFNEVSLDVFWISLRQEYPVVSAKALDTLLQFSVSYFCEQAFSCLTVIKSKSRHRLLSIEEELRVCQKFGQEFNSCAKRNVTKCHTEDKPYIDFVM